MNGLRILLLRASRLVRRSPARSLLTGFLVACSVVFGSLWLSQSRGHHEADVSVDSVLGRADLRYDLFDGAMTRVFEETADGPDTAPLGEQVDAVLESLPEGSEVAVLEWFDEFRAGNAEISDPLRVYQAPWADPLLDGVVDLADGRLPGPGEVVVPPTQAVALGVDIGDRLVILEPAVVLDVVGIGSTGTWPQLLVAEGEFVLSDASAQGVRSPFASAAVFATLPDRAAVPRVDIGSTPGAPQLVVPLERSDITQMSVGSSTGIIMFVVALVGLSAGAAFGIGATRRRRASGLLSANGATQSQLRLAAGAEAIVVSVPAVALGSVSALALPSVWLRFRLAGWDRLWPIVVPVPWVVLLAVAAVVAATFGTIVFSRSVSNAEVPALLDDRRATRRDVRARPRRGMSMLMLVAVGLVLLVPLIRLASAGQQTARGWGVLAALVVWLAGAVVVVAFARRVLARHAVGRIVGRDLARRPVGAGAAVMVIALWSFAAVVGTLTAGIGGDDSSEPLEQARSSVERESATGTITIQPPVAPAVRHRSSATSEPPSAIPDGLSGRLAAYGLRTQRATVGVFAGPCPVCPNDYRPTVMVLDSVEGLGLERQAEDALQSGSIVTGIDLDGLDGSTVAGLPVTFAPMQLNANAVMLAEFAPEGDTLEEPVEVLVGSTTELSDSAAASVATELADSGVSVNSDDARVQPITSGEANGLGQSESRSLDPLWWATSLLVLALVTLAVTASHRREHGEAAHVLWVLGAGPGASRQLAALTAGALAAAGVMIGCSTAGTVIGVTWSGRTDLNLSDVLEPSRVLAVLAVLFVVPTVASLLGRLLPPLRSDRSDLRPA